MHSPGYVDEFVCEIDTGGPSDKFWWVLQDPNYNVVALVSDGDGSLSRGEVARQYSWSPYGQLLRADIYDTSAPMSRLGHQGLFHDRLDADILAEPMVAFSDQTVQNRNRTLSPRLGRFLQRDPNATALAVLDGLANRGVAIRLGFEDAAMEALFADGVNIFAYQMAMPTASLDPMGLSLLGLGIGATTTADLRGDWDQQVGEVGLGLKGLVEGMLSDTMIDQMFDTMWALDWDAADWDYSGGMMPGVASATPSAEEFAMAGRIPWNAKRRHHIATHYGQIGKRFKAMFKKAGLSIHNDANLMDVMWKYHKGRGHSAAYHEFVFKHLSKRIGSKTGEAAKKALLKGLDELKEIIDNDPGILSR